MGGILLKLEVCSLSPKSARPVRGRRMVIIRKIDANIMGYKHTKKFCSSFKTGAAPAISRNKMSVCSDFHYISINRGGGPDFD